MISFKSKKCQYQFCEKAQSLIASTDMPASKSLCSKRFTK